ncbi:MAG: hypothetical protein LIP23_03580 [Planctomycetes bacterium]|nr:hypothetical protein [Planctomycetota bacterium]
MENNSFPAGAAVPPPRRYGCLKLTCGGCVGVLALVCIAALALWFLLNRWEIGSTAWEHLPPSTVWALEFHDAKQLMNHAGSGERLSRLVTNNQWLMDQLQACLDTLTLDDEDAVRELRRGLRVFETVFTAVFPNIAGFGMGGENADQWFFYCRPPTWLRWLLRFGSFSSGNVEYLEDESIYCGMIEGWLLVSDTRPILDEFIQHWSSGIKPLGSALKRRDAYVNIGFRSEQMRQISLAATRGNDAGQEIETTPPPLFADPFADIHQPPPEKPALHMVRMALYPLETAWRVSGTIETAVAESGAVEPNPILNDRTPLWTLGHSTGRLPDIRVGARLSEHQYSALLAWLDSLSGRPAPEDSPPWKALGWHWLRHVWLDNANREFILTSRPPARQGRIDGVQPLPVTNIGWSLADHADAAALAKQFDDSLNLLFQSITAPGGNPALQAIRQSIAYQSEVNSSGGTGSLTMPPVLANAARPVWKIADTNGRGIGWLATDPTGLPSGRIDANFKDDVNFFSNAAGNGAVIAWDVTPEFLDAVKTIIHERLGHGGAAVAPTRRGEEEIDPAEAIDRFFSLFPYGLINIHQLNDDTWAVRAGF